MRINKSIKNLAKIIFINISKMIIPLFFSKEFLKGKYFDNVTIGWRWAWAGIFWQKIVGINRNILWPVSPRIKINKSDSIDFHVDDIINFHTFGSYFQNISGRITIGKGSRISFNVGILTTNHDPIDLDRHLPGKNVIIGKKCWIGMNSVILPGVVLGPRTIVGAGSVVTKSFVEGNCLIAGNPAEEIKNSPLNINSQALPS